MSQKPGAEIDQENEETRPDPLLGPQVISTEERGRIVYSSAPVPSVSDSPPPLYLP